MYISELICMPMLNVDNNTFKRVTRNPSTNRGVGPQHGEVRRAHQMLNAALTTGLA